MLLRPLHLSGSGRKTKPLYLVDWNKINTRAFLFFKLIFFMCIAVLSAIISVWGHQTFWNWSHRQLWSAMRQEWNPGPRQEQPVLLSDEPALRPLHRHSIDSSHGYSDPSFPSHGAECLARLRSLSHWVSRIKSSLRFRCLLHNTVPTPTFPKNTGPRRKSYRQPHTSPQLRVFRTLTISAG